MTSCAPKVSIASVKARENITNVKPVINSIRCCRIAKERPLSQLDSASSSS